MKSGVGADGEQGGTDGDVGRSRSHQDVDKPSRPSSVGWLKRSCEAAQSSFGLEWKTAF